MRKNSSSACAAFFTPRFSPFFGLFRSLRLQIALSVLLSAAALSHAQPAALSCGSQLGLTVLLSATWEPVAVPHPDVVCAFRSKGRGFPTLTVTREAPATAATRRSIERRIAAVTDSYRAIGLSDARVLRVYQGYSAEQPLQLLLEYTTNSTPMSALIKVVDTPAGTFVLTALDRTRDTATTLPESEAIADSFPGDGTANASKAATTGSEPSLPSHSIMWFMLLVGAAFVGAALARILIARVRSSARSRKS
jgi:hypothetical protein